MHKATGPKGDTACGTRIAGRVAALREQTLGLLEAYRQRSTAGRHESDIIDGLQDAANRLGAVQHYLQSER